MRSGWHIYVGQDRLLHKASLFNRNAFPVSFVASYFSAIFRLNNSCACMCHLLYCPDCINVFCLIVASSDYVQTLRKLVGLCKASWDKVLIFVYNLFELRSSRVKEHSESLRVGRFWDLIPNRAKGCNFSQSVSFRPWGQSGLLINGYGGSLWKA